MAGTIDILVNNAGTTRRHPAADFPIEDWDAVLRPNLDAAWILAQHFGRGMVARGRGKIVNVASLLSFSGGITVPAYAASKHAIAGLTKALANEWARHGVQVNAVAPGYFRTDNTQPLQHDPTRSTEISARGPVGRAAGHRGRGNLSRVARGGLRQRAPARRRRRVDGQVTATPTSNRTHT